LPNPFHEFQNAGKGLQGADIANTPKTGVMEWHGQMGLTLYTILK
jgi:hypothetical protein